MMVSKELLCIAEKIVHTMVRVQALSLPTCVSPSSPELSLYGTIKVIDDSRVFSYKFLSGELQNIGIGVHGVDD